MPRRDVEEKAYLTPGEAAELLAVSRKTIQRRIADGTIPTVRLGAKLVRIRRADLDRALSAPPMRRRPGRPSR